ncbi:MAG: hypothetical protein K2I10_02035 [Lachnospiraceae bacterium]|nr:hypothetical protein [Lachnospiraceae bacterium]
MKRTVDKPYFTYCVSTAVTSGLYVKCPKCDGPGIIKADDDIVCFRCTNCGNSKTRERNIYCYEVNNQCSKCGRYYRVSISDSSKQHFPMLYVACPCCGYTAPGKVLKSLGYRYTGGIENGREPFFGFELWFLTSYDRKFVWALNREHLAYLIDYLSADLREKPPIHGTMRTQADQIPAFMKTAKNRDRIVKCLKRMQEK